MLDVIREKSVPREWTLGEN